MDFLHTWIVPPSANAAPAVYIAVAVVALLLTSVSKGGFGGGAGVLSVPLMLQVAPDSKFVLGMWLPVLIVCDICTIRHYPKEWNPKAFFQLTPGMLLGIAITTFALSAAVSAQELKALDTFLKLSVAVISIVFLILQLRGQKASDTPWVPTWTVALPVGLTAGITTMIAHAAGPIITMFLLPQKMDQRVYMGTCGRFFFIFNSLKVPFTIAAGAMTLMTMRYGAWLLLLSPLGVWLGAWLNKRLSAKWFVRVVQISLVIAAAKLVYDAVLAMQSAPVPVK